MNEPNAQMWPQRDSRGNLMSPGKAAGMMQTASAFSGWVNHEVLLGAPATADYRGANGRYQTHYFDFVYYLVQALRNINYYGMPTYIWTHHNYRDVAHNDHQSTNGIRLAINGYWRGWSAVNNSGAHPGIWITEGGSKLDEAGSEQEQGMRVWSEWNRCASDPQVFMSTNYLLHSDPRYDTGLRNPIANGGGPRLVYWNFKGFPGNA